MKKPLKPGGYAGRARLLAAYLLLAFLAACNLGSPNAQDARAGNPYAELATPRDQARVLYAVASDALEQIKHHYWPDYDYRPRIPRYARPFARKVPPGFYGQLETMLREAARLRPDLADVDFDRLRIIWDQAVTMDQAEQVTDRLVIGVTVLVYGPDPRDERMKWALRFFVDMDAWEVLYWEVNTHPDQIRLMPWSEGPARMIHSYRAFSLFDPFRIALPPGMSFEDLTKLEPGGLERLYYVAVSAPGVSQPSLYADDRGHYYERSLAQGVTELTPTGSYPLDGYGVR
ncbi:hypothetical protein [Oceanithermus sp.]